MADTLFYIFAALTLLCGLLPSVSLAPDCDSESLSKAGEREIVNVRDALVFFIVQ